jgi:signal transduction histidine kinase/CheY-like chemotaxis protein
MKNAPEDHKIHWHSSLVVRSMMSVLILMVVVIGTAAYFNTQKLRKDMAQKVNAEGVYLTRIMTQAVALPVWNLDKAEVQQQLETLRGSPNVCGARVIDKNNYVFADSSYPAKLTASQAAYVKDILYDDPRNAQVMLEKIGRFELCITDEGFESDVSETITTELAFLAFLTLAVLAAYGVSLLIIVRPLRTIRQAMENLGSSMKQIREPDLLKANEIGAISYSFNKMVVNLSKTYNILKISREKAVKTDQAKTEFLANMSHELRTPLNIIIGMTQIMERDDVPNEYKESFSLINTSSQTLLNIVNDILDLTKIEAGEMRLENITFDIGQKVNHVGSAMTSLAARKGLTLEYYCSLKDHIVMGDPLRFERILVNLIGNAIRYTDSGGITIKAHYKETEFNQIRFFCEVIDTGIGIPEDKLGKVFDKFSQADTSITRRFGGTGLGLTITKQLVEMMGGKIGVESTVGQGTTFWFQIPFVLSDKVTDPIANVTKIKQADALNALATHASDARILLAEDNEINRTFMTKLLQSHGITNVDWVDNGLDAIEQVQKDRYDLVLMDCNMPQMSGYEAAEKIRALDSSPANSVPIVALTANAMPSDRERCLAIGMNGYLSKPFKLDEFVDTLSQWIKLDKAA